MQNDRARTLPAAALLTALFPGAPTGLPIELPTTLAGASPGGTTAAAPRSTQAAARLPARSAGPPAGTTTAAPQSPEAAARLHARSASLPAATTAAAPQSPETAARLRARSAGLPATTTAAAPQSPEAAARLPARSAGLPAATTAAAPQSPETAARLPARSAGLSAETTATWPQSPEAAARLPARSAGLPAATTAAPPQLAETPYERRLAQYRSGDFVGAVRESRELPIRELRGAAESFLDRRPGGNAARDREFLAAALLHLDLAGPAEAAPEENERIARRLLDRVRGADRAWTRDAHVGLLGFYMEYGRLEDALRVARFLGEEFRADADARLARGHLAALIGWMFHDERFFDQARDTYETAILARESDAGAEPPTDLRLRLAHLVLRDGDAEGALAGLESAAAADFDARQRFLAHLLRGEALLWLDRAAEAEEAFAAAQAHHIGSISAAAGLAAVRQRLGDTAGAGEAARIYLSAGGDADTWWDFLLRGLTAERPRLATLRALVLQ